MEGLRPAFVISLFTEIESKYKLRRDHSLIMLLFKTPSPMENNQLDTSILELKYGTHYLTT